MKNIIKTLDTKVLIFDGSKGIMLRKMGLKEGECEESWNLYNKDKVRELYMMYRDAGADIIQTNTFQGNRLKLEENGLGDKVYEVNYNAAKIAKEVMQDYGYVAASIGPIGKMYEPLGDMTFKKAFDIYSEQIKALVDGGVDIINFETFIDIEDMKIAVCACKEVCNLPIIASMSYDQNGRTLMGTSAEICAYILKGLGVEVIGANCSFGAELMMSAVDMYQKAGMGPLSVKPNAGLPEIVGSDVVYSQTADEFVKFSSAFVERGVRIIGGCCGTTPEYIAKLAEKLKGRELPKVTFKPKQVITSLWEYIDISQVDKLNLIKIDCDTDNAVYNSIKENNMQYVIDKVLDSDPDDYHAVYFNIDKAKRGDFVLRNLVNELQEEQIRLPFIFETSSSSALISVLKVYKGRAGVIVGRLPYEKMEKCIKVAKKYGAAIIGENILN